jgi:hypothetical protein
VLKDPSIFIRGIGLAVAWLAWALGGAVYANMHSPFSAFFETMSQPTKALVYAWILVSTALLYFAIVFLIRGMTGRASRPRA